MYNKLGERIMEKSRDEAMVDDRLDMWDFEENVNNLGSTDDPEKRNVSTKSSVLGPQCSSRSNKDDVKVIDIIKDADMLVDTRAVPAVLTFAPRVYNANRAYEACNNRNFDDGVHNRGSSSEDSLDPRTANKKKKARDKEEKFDADAAQDLPHTIDRFKMDGKPLFSEKFKPTNNKDIYQILSRWGFPFEHIKSSLDKNINNHCTTTYYLLAKNQGIIHK